MDTPLTTMGTAAGCCARTSLRGRDAHKPLAVRDKSGV
jgi:hypothetical protein